MHPFLTSTKYYIVQVLVSLQHFFATHGITFLLFLPCYMLLLIIIIENKKYFISKKAREFLDMGEHQEKQATPSMGGLAFYSLLFILYWYKGNTPNYWFLVLSAGLSGIIGAIDDWYKIQKGTGLTVKIKFLLQMGSALFAGIYFAYMVPHDCFINFFGYHLYLGNYYALWIAWVIMATTHAVNLIDGIDGLAISQVWMIGIISPASDFIPHPMLFNWFCNYFWNLNRYKAKLFMGDVGAFFLGGLLAAIFIIQRCEILLIIAGIILVINTLMVIIQTTSYKLRKKRVFSFTPYHHALEKKGWSENKICLIYAIITACTSLLSLLLYIKYF